MIAALQQQMGGSFENQMSAGAKAVTSIGTAWDTMLTKLSSTRGVQAARDAVIGMLNGISGAVSNKITDAGVDAYQQRLAVGRQQAGYLAPQVGAPSGVNYGAGGALSGIAASNVDLGNLNAEFARRLQLWFDDLSDADKALVTITSGARTVAQQADIYARGGIAAAPGGSGHNFGVAADITGMSQTARALLSLYGLHTPVAGDPVHVEPFETPLSTVASAAQRRAAFQSFSGTYGSGVFANVGQGAAGPVVSSEPSQEQLTRLGQLTQHLSDIDKATAKLGDDKIWWTSYFQALGPGERDVTAIWTAMAQANSAVAQHRTELEKAAETQRITNNLALDTAAAFGKDEVSGLRAAAQAQAELAVRAGDAGSAQAKAAELLRTGAAEAMGASAKALPGLVQQTAATQRLADAAKTGAFAEHEAEVQNQITTATHDALTKAIATGDPALISRAQKLRDMTAEQIKNNDAALQSKAIQDRINERTDQIAVVQLQTGLVGQTPEVVAAATAHLQEQQRLMATIGTLDDDRARAALKNVDALSQANIQLANATRESGRWGDAIRSIAETVDQTLVRALEDAFNGKKITDFAAMAKSALSSIGAQLINGLLLRPALGEPLGLAPWGEFGK